MSKLALAVAVSVVALSSSVVAQQIPNIAGNYVCEGPCQIPGGGTRVYQFGPRGEFLGFVNEVGQISGGVFDLANPTRLSGWNMWATLSADRRVIRWDSNTQWVRRFRR